MCEVLHWLPVTQWIQFTIATTAFDCIRGIGRAYFKDVAPQWSAPPVKQTSVRPIEMTYVKHVIDWDKAKVVDRDAQRQTR